MTTSLKIDRRTITVGRTHPYASRKHEGRGRVEKIEKKLTGTWVTLFDKARGKAVTVRPSQVKAA